jgi:hypothetical protein
MQLGAAEGKGDGRWDRPKEAMEKAKCCCRKLATTTKERRPIARRWRGAMPGAIGTWHSCLPAWGGATKPLDLAVFLPSFYLLKKLMDESRQNRENLRKFY